MLSIPAQVIELSCDLLHAGSLVGYIGVLQRVAALWLSRAVRNRALYNTELFVEDMHMRLPQLCNPILLLPLRCLSIVLHGPLRTLPVATLPPTP